MIFFDSRFIVCRRSTAAGQIVGGQTRIGAPRFDATSRLLSESGNTTAELRTPVAELIENAANVNPTSDGRTITNSRGEGRLPQWAANVWQNSSPAVDEMFDKLGHRLLTIGGPEHLQPANVDFALSGVRAKLDAMPHRGLRPTPHRVPARFGSESRIASEAVDDLLGGFGLDLFLKSSAKKLVAAVPGLTSSRPSIGRHGTSNE